MMNRKSMPGVLLPLGIALLLTACGQEQQPAPEVERILSQAPVLSVTSEPIISEPEQSDNSAPSFAATSSPIETEESTPEPPMKTEGSHTDTPSSVSEAPQPIVPPVTSQPTAPPKTSAPSTERPTMSVSDSSPPPTTPSETDGQTIIKQIREYGETKGFVWNDALTFGSLGVGYYGRPNLADDGVEGVINMLKYHCDKIEREYGIYYFHAIQREYEGKTEFIVLYA